MNGFTRPPQPQIATESRFPVPVPILISVVIVTLAIVALAVTAILTLVQVGRTAARMAESVQVSLEQLERAVHEANQLMATVRDITPAAVAVAERFRRLGSRAADLSTAVLDEVESPVYRATAIAHGLRIGAAHLLERLTRRYEQTNHSHNGEQSHE